MTTRSTLPCVAAVLLGLSGAGVATAQQPPVAVATFQTDLGKLGAPRVEFQPVLGDVAPSAADLKAFLQAYTEFVAPPVARAVPSAAAVDDVVRRQLNLKTMEHLGLRNTFLGRLLVAVIMKEAPHYAHAFSPYRDRLVIPGVDAPRTPDRTPAAAAAGVGPVFLAVDPATPQNFAAALLNNEVALIAGFVDALKKLQLPANGDGLYQYLTANNADADPRVVSLVLAVLADPDVSVNPASAVSFLTTHPERVGLVRYFLLHKTVPVPTGVNDLTLRMLGHQAFDATAYAEVIRPKALEMLGTVASLTAVTDFQFVTDLANGALSTKSADAPYRAGYIDTLAKLTAVGLAQKKKGTTDMLTDRLGRPLGRAITNALDTVGDAAAKPGERATALNFLTAVGPVVRATYTGQDVQKVVVPMLKAFMDVKLYEKQPGTRLAVLTFLSTLGPTGNVAGVCTVLEGLLFSSSPAEQAAILETLGYLRGLREVVEE